MDPNERKAQATKNVDKCDFIIRKELTFSAFAIIAFAVTYQKTSSIPYLIDIVVYSFLLSGFFSIVLLHKWKYKYELILVRDWSGIEEEADKTALSYIKIYNFLYKFLYVVGVLSAVLLYATSKSVIPAP